MLGRTVYDNMQENPNINLELSAPGTSYGDVTEGIGGSRYRGFSGVMSAANMIAGNSSSASYNLLSGYNVNPVMGMVANPFMQFGANKVYGNAYGAMAIDSVKGVSDLVLNRMGLSLEWDSGGDGLGKLGGLNVSFNKMNRQKHLARKALQIDTKRTVPAAITKSMDFATSALGFGSKGLVNRASSLGMKAAIGGSIAGGLGEAFGVDGEDMGSVVATGAAMGIGVEVIGNTLKGALTKQATNSVFKSASAKLASEATVQTASSALGLVSVAAGEEVAATVGERTKQSLFKRLGAKYASASGAKGLAKLTSGALKASNAIGWVDSAIDMASIANEVRMGQQMEMIKNFPSKQMAMIHNSSNQQNVGAHTSYSMSNEMELNYLLSMSNPATANYNNYSN